MGLYIHSLDQIPSEANRGYFVYLLDYGWTEPLGEALMKNYERMAHIASQNNAVIIKGTSEHFVDEVFSWHQINGEEGGDVLPAILITNRHPEEFRERHSNRQQKAIEENLKLVIVPLKKFCRTTTDVMSLVDKIFIDIREKRDLNEFKVSKSLKRGVGRALADALILEPNFSGVGFNFKQFFQDIIGR